MSRQRALADIFWRLRWERLGAIATVSLSVLLPVLGLSQTAAANDDAPITLTAGSAEVEGVTVGEFSLTQLAARDRHRKLCLGYGARQPDHTLVLSEAQPRLRVAVNSDGGDTTLLIQGPWGIDCNDSHRRDHQDAAIVHTNWPAGTYQIWVGAFDQDEQLDYVLQVAEPPESARR